jgi:hypothetical protein
MFGMPETTEFGKIETLYERNKKFKVNVGQFKNRTYTLLKSWLWTEKVDGTNMRVIWENGNTHFAGKTDTANISGDLINWMHNNITCKKMQEVFPSNMVDPLEKVVLYGEGYGAGIQKGGGDYCAFKNFILFDVRVINPDGDWWLSYENVLDVGNKLSLFVVPAIGEMTLEDATEFVRVGFKSRCSVNPEKMAEGLVGRPLETLYDKKGARLITKLKTKDF